MGCNTSKDATSLDEKSSKKAERENEVKIVQESKPASAKTITLSSNGSLIKDSLEQAATKIQAAFRGHQTRKSMKHSSKDRVAGSQGNTQNFEVNSDLSEAATKIQASFRGHLARKQMEKKDKTPETQQDKKNDNDEELDIDLSDPDLNKAAVKIQASFRGHLARKEEDEQAEANSKEK